MTSEFGRVSGSARDARDEAGGGAAAGTLSLDRLAPLTPNAWLRYDVVDRMLPSDVATVLEVGCGQGALGARLSARCRYVGMEPDPDSFRVAEQRFARLAHGEVRRTTIDALDPAERFDLVCAFEVLEHIEDDAETLRRWANALNPGGWLMLSVPAYQHRYSAADQLVGHYRRYDPADLASLVERVGFEEVEVCEYGAPLGYLLEFGRNALGRRRLKRMNGVSMQQRSGASGRLFQPSNALASALTRYGTAPFRHAQHVFRHGPGLVLRAKLPGSTATRLRGSQA